MKKKQILVTTQSTIPLGYQGENDVTEVVFPQDFDLMAEEWQLNHQRATDRGAYPCSLEKRGDTLVWRVTSGDTAIHGIGAAELTCYGKGGEILKSRTYNTHVAKSVTTGGEVPDPVRPWYEDILGKLDQAGSCTVKSVNGVAPDASGNVEIEVGSGGSAVSLDPTLSQEGKSADAKAVGDALKEKQPVGDYALKTDIPTAPVQSVNGKTGAVQLGAADVGALPNTTKIPGKTSDLTNDSGYLTSYTETDPTVPAWAKAAQKPTYTAAEVGADSQGTAANAVSAHNTDTTAHEDIRALVSGLTERLNALANSDDEALDQMAEIVAYIKSNRTLIEQVTTGKVSVSDIVDNLTTNAANKPLSAARGVALKKLIDAITVPTKVSQLTNDAGYLTQHQDISGKLDADKLPESVNAALAQAKASGEFDGEDGDSVTVASVTESTADGGNNVVKFSNGKTVTIKNGGKGNPGKDGEDGYTPVRGTDYWTDADQEAIVQQVITALGTPVFGTVDADKVITLSGALAEGKYTIRYEDADGNYTTIGTLDNREVTYTNQLAIATDENGAVWNGVGYADGYRLHSYSGVNTGGNNALTSTDGWFVTGFIPYTIEQAKNRVPFYVKGITLDLANLSDYLRASMTVPGNADWFGVAKLTDMTDISLMTITQLGENYYKFTPNENFYLYNAWNNKDTTHIRFSMPGSGSGVVITVNEPIE